MTEKARLRPKEGGSGKADLRRVGEKIIVWRSVSPNPDLRRTKLFIKEKGITGNIHK